MRFGILGVLLVLLVVFGLGCSFLQQRVVAVDDEGYLLKSDGTRVTDSAGQPVKAPEGSITTIGALGILAGGVMAMRVGGGLLSRLPPPWGLVATFLLGGTGLTKEKEAQKT